MTALCTQIRNKQFSQVHITTETPYKAITGFEFRGITAQPVVIGREVERATATSQLRDFKRGYVLNVSQ